MLVYTNFPFGVNALSARQVRGRGGRPRICRLTLHFGEFTADWSAVHDEDYGAGARARLRREESVNKITQKMRKRRYMRAAWRISLGEYEGNSPSVPAQACMLHQAFRLCYNNNDNCNERQIAEATITLLNRDIVRPLETYS